MSDYEKLTLFIASLAFLASLISIYIAVSTRETTKKISRRQGVIELHNAWQPINEIDRKALIAPDIINAANALTLTASLWNNDVMEKNILYDSYWDSYSTLYDQLYSIEELIPGRNKSCKSLITPSIQKAYKEMKDFHLNGVRQTRL